MQKLCPLFACLAAIAVVGCATSEPVVVKSPSGATPTAPFATPPAASAPNSDDANKAMASAKKRYEDARAAFGKDVKQKPAYVKATNEYAMSMMSNEGLSAKEKYTGALRLYREAHKADPNDAESKKWIAEIEGIYTGMGRPIPQ